MPMQQPQTPLRQRPAPVVKAPACPLPRPSCSRAPPPPLPQQRSVHDTQQQPAVVDAAADTVAALLHGTGRVRAGRDSSLAAQDQAVQPSAAARSTPDSGDVSFRLGSGRVRLATASGTLAHSLRAPSAASNMRISSSGGGGDGSGGTLAVTARLGSFVCTGGGTDSRLHVCSVTGALLGSPAPQPAGSGVPTAVSSMGASQQWASGVQQSSDTQPPYISLRGRGWAAADGSGPPPPPQSAASQLGAGADGACSSEASGNWPFGSGGVDAAGVHSFWGAVPATAAPAHFRSQPGSQAASGGSGGGALAVPSGGAFFQLPCDAAAALRVAPEPARSRGLRRSFVRLGMRL